MWHLKISAAVFKYLLLDCLCRDIGKIMWQQIKLLYLDVKIFIAPHHNHVLLFHLHGIEHLRPWWRHLRLIQSNLPVLVPPLNLKEKENFRTKDFLNYQVFMHQRVLFCAKYYFIDKVIHFIAIDYLFIFLSIGLI